MKPGDPPEEFATIVSVSPSSLPPQTPGSSEVFHRSCPAPGPSRGGIITQQSDALLSQSAPVRPQLTRGQSQIQSAIAGSAKFVGLPYHGEAPDRSDWDSRRLRFLNKRYKLKDSVLQQPDGHGDLHSVTPTAVETPSLDGRFATTGPVSFIARSPSQDSRVRLEKRDSVAKVVFDAVTSLVKRGTISRPKPRHAPLAARSSFDVEAFDEFVSGSPVIGAAMASVDVVPTIPEELSTEVAEEEAEKPEEPPEIPADDGGEFVEMQSLPRPDSLSSGTRPLDRAADEGLKPESLRRSVSARARAFPEPVGEPLLSADAQYRTVIPVEPSLPPGIGRLDLGSSSLNPPQHATTLGIPEASDVRRVTDRVTPSPFRKLTKQKSIDEPEEPEMHFKRMEKVMDHLKHELVPHRKKRYRGIGPFGRLFNYHLGRKQVGKLPQVMREKLEAGEDERPFFTYWVTCVQIIVFFLSIIRYGFGPVGFEGVEHSGEVMDTSLALRHVSYFQPGNIWIGPSVADLVRLGAKYSPCMRKERDVWRDIYMERRKENETACCIFNDRAGCYQSGQSGCPRNIATWMKWTAPRKGLTRSKSDSTLLKPFDDAFNISIWNKIPHSRSAGSVCGQDPDFCIVPRSSKAREWPDDLTQWPICRQSRTEGALPAHLTCQITGRPCCIQMQGQCRIASKQYCEFVHGHWHENATLCSQVDCFGDICGMLPFFTKDHPNQAYRLFTSLFIHAGIIHLGVTIFVQRWLMVDLENLIGWKRMAFVYIGSGVGGNLASAIFVPYNPEVGPSGSQLGILAALIVDVIHHRKYIHQWHKALGVHLVVVLVLFLLGVVPYVDNWAHLFGFIFGLLITMSVFPYLDFSSKPVNAGQQNIVLSLFPSRRCVFVVVSLASCFLLFLILAYIYFANVEVNCPFCGYFNCLSFGLSDHFCDNKGLELTHMLPI